MKIRYLGKLIDEAELEELAPAPPPPIEYHFAEVRLTPRSIDRASQHVPEEVWKPKGVHTWLQEAANGAWAKAPTTKDPKAKEIRYRGPGKRIEFVFERDGDVPVLKTVIIH